MSTQPAHAMIPQAEPPKDPSELTEAYRDARAVFILVAGLLASWELIGISLEPKPNWGFEIESATKAGLPILLIFVIFLGYIMNITWTHCNPESRKHAAPNRTPRTAHRIALIAIAIAIIQYLLHNQIAAYIARHQRQAFAVAAVLAFGLAVGSVGEILHAAATTPKMLKWLLITTILLAVSYGFQAVERRSYSLVFAAFPGTICAWLLYYIRWRTKATKA